VCRPVVGTILIERKGIHIVIINLFAVKIPFIVKLEALESRIGQSLDEVVVLAAAHIADVVCSVICLSGLN